MNLYFDTEFTGLVPNTTLISIGIVSENGKKFYAEFTDYKKELCDDWIKENVIKNLAQYQNPDLMHLEFTQFYDYLMEHDDEIRYAVGNTFWIKRCLTEWLDICFKKDERFQFVSDVCHYDFYLLQNQVFGGAFEMPEYINPVCYDICQDINERSCMGVGNNFNMTSNMYNAFDISREKLAEDALLELPKGIKHNALYDAEVIKLLYEYYYSKKFVRRKMETIENFKAHRGWCRDTFDSWFEDSEYVQAVDFSQEELYEKALKAIGEEDGEL